MSIYDREIDNSRKPVDFPIGIRVGLLFGRGNHEKAACSFVQGYSADSRVMIADVANPGIQMWINPSHLWAERTAS